MKKIFVYFLLLGFNFSFSQEVLRLENPGTENFEYIEFNIQLDDNDSILEIHQNFENTTFKDLNVIENLKNNYSKFRKEVFGLDNFSDIPNHSKEISSTIVLINPDYHTLKIENVEDCKDLKAGTYSYGDNIYKDTRIYRYANEQIELNEESYLKYEISWDSPCHYNLKLQQTNSENYRQQFEKTISVEIIKVTPNYYIYRSKMEGDSSRIGMIKMIKS